MMHLFILVTLVMLWVDFGLQIVENLRKRSNKEEVEPVKVPLYLRFRVVGIIFFIMGIIAFFFE